MEVDVGLNLDECCKDNAPGLNLNIIYEGEKVDSGKDPRTSSIAEKDNQLVPYIGMEFSSLEEAFSFYTSYAKSVGFGVSTKASRRSKLSRQFIDAKFACTRHGVKRESNAIKPRPCLKIGCKATLHVKRKNDEKWFVHNFVEEHNHDLFPIHAHYFSCQRRISPADQHNIDNLRAVEVGTCKIYSAMAKKHGGYQNIGCLEKDIRNHLDKERRFAIESGDAREKVDSGKDSKTSSVAEKDNHLVPHIGMEFSSLEEAFLFYTSYAKSVGFGVSTKASRRSKLSRQFIDAKFACTRHGVKRESSAINPRPCLKIDCKATLHVKRKNDEKWSVHNFVEEHNHDLFPIHGPCQRRISPAN